MVSEPVSLAERSKLGAPPHEPKMLFVIALFSFFLVAPPTVACFRACLSLALILFDPVICYQGCLFRFLGGTFLVRMGYTRQVMGSVRDGQLGEF